MVLQLGVGRWLTTLRRKKTATPRNVTQGRRLILCNDLTNSKLDGLGSGRRPVVDSCERVDTIMVSRVNQEAGYLLTQRLLASQERLNSMDTGK
jgi:hypothetical protein